MRSISFMNPCPLATRLVDKIATPPVDANVPLMNPGPSTTRLVDKISAQSFDAHENEFWKPSQESSVNFESSEATNESKPGNYIRKIGRFHSLDFNFHGCSS